jgi:acyl-CoA synthetase (AMP-forming)/AMP-acid ligase II
MGNAAPGPGRGWRTFPLSFNLANLFEAVVDRIPDREAVIVGDRRLTYSMLDERANRLANALRARGVRDGESVGLHMMNGTEYLEGMLACFKIRAIPINVNFRYVEAELFYLYDDADLVTLIYHRQFAPRVAATLWKTPAMRLLVCVEDGSDEQPVEGSESYEEVLAESPTERPDAAGRSSDDLYCVYTGGTTGMPKGVIWRHEDIFKAAMGGGDITQLGNHVTGASELAERVPEIGIVALGTPPLMHSSAHWLAFQMLFTGGTLVMTPLGRFDPATIWSLVTRERVAVLVVVGDAIARPLVEELEAHRDSIDISNLWVIGSGGAMLTDSTKQRLLELLPGRMIADGFGSSETGVVGAKQGSRFVVNDQTSVLDDDGNPIAPGSGIVGRLARRGHIPLRYHKDEEKTAKTFIESDGVRWVLPGDMATIEEDGSITLLGRGSLTINTGGEKVFPEEVEEPLRDHPMVADAVVVGVPDERWGERVVAVVETRSGTTPTLKELQEHCRARLAGYKVPRELVIVDTIVRSPAGKPDYTWAKEQATKAMTGGAVK